MRFFVSVACIASVAGTAPPTKGPYDTANKRDYKITGMDSGKMHVYYPKGSKGEKFPLISYAHGLAGGSVDLLGYATHFSQLASWGFVLVAPNTCNFGCKDAVKSPYADCNQVAVTGKNPDAAGWNTWFGEQLKAIEMARNLSQSGDSIFETVDWDAGVAIAGHSMGGQATAWAAHQNCTSQWNIKAAAVQHGVYGTTNEKIGVPVIAMGGTKDADITVKTKDVFTKSPTYPKVFRDIVGGPHVEPVLSPNPLLATYTAAWFKFNLGLDKDSKYHDMIFGNNEDSLCKSQAMNECILDEHKPAVLATAEGVLPPSEAEIEPMWARFKKDFSRSYEDEARRWAAFKKNVVSSFLMNMEQGVNCTDLFDDPNCVFGITKFSDLSEDEFAATRLGFKPVEDRDNVNVLTLEDLPAAPDAVDWRPKGAVTSVKDQGQCGSCWAFSTTEEIESQVFMATGALPTLSTQQIISCDKGQDQGCDGGDTVTAYKYVQKAGGLDTGADYPDKSHKSGNTGKCTWDKKVAAKVTGFTYATKPCNSGACKNQDEDALAAALAAKGPVSICVNAAGNGWQSYKRGVFSKKCSGASSKLDHCVQLVGYDKSGATPYWIVRNSWNTDWGIDGYMHLEMGKNLCGVADEATIVQATKASEVVVVV